MFINVIDTNNYNENYKFEDLYNDNITIAKPEYKIKTLNIPTTQKTIDYMNTKHNINMLVNRLRYLLNTIPVDKTNLRSYYNSFTIPKRTGGLRQIDAPTKELEALLRSLYDCFKQYHILPHNAAHAYTIKRDTMTAVKQHKNSNWFLKLDIKDFFPNCNKELLYTKLKHVYPFTVIDNIDKNMLEDIIDVCLLDNALPQGTNMSPFITNMIMVPFDELLTKYTEKRNMVYTRYADDIFISSPEPFHFKAVTSIVNKSLHTLNYPFKIKEEKTRYGSIKSANWNLGLMLNKDHNITIGHKKKKIFKAILNNFICDLTNGTKWSIIDIQQALGLYSYYHRIEPDYIDYIVERLKQKYGINAITEMHRRIKQH